MPVASSQLSRLLAGAPEVLPLTQAGFPQQQNGCPLGIEHPATLFPGARSSQAAVAGLLLRFGCWSDSHNVAQEIQTVEGSYWHAILHRLEPDSSNAAYWFRRVGQHAIFPDLHRRAAEILKERGPKQWRLKSGWDPFLFLEWCDEARQKSSEAEKTAQAIQMAEWKLLFGWCAASIST